MWQLGMIEDKELLGRGKCTLFPDVTSAHHFVFKKPGYRQLETFLNKYKMAQSSARFIDPEGFYEIFRQRTKARRYTHSFYYPKDIVRNELSLLEQEVKKEKWRVFSKTMDFISNFDKQYDPLADCKLMGDRINKLMTHFASIMEVLNEKKKG